MEDRSMIKPILEALEYFSSSDEELQFYYKVIDKFCATWFGSKILASKFTKLDYLLIHDLLGEYIRFESNNKRVALWILSINRVCYNYSVNLSFIKKDLSEIGDAIDDTLDTSLIEPIVNNLKEFEKLHLQAGVDNRGEADVIGNFLQWVGLYTSYIYPSLENKENFYDKNIIKAMNFLLVEFIKQKSNDKRLAFLIMAIMEACSQYSLRDDINSVIIEDMSSELSEGAVIPGTEENMVSELLNKLKEENDKQRQRPILSKEILADQYIKDSFDLFIEDLNYDVNESVSVFNNYVNTLTNKFVTFDQGKQFLFMQTLNRYRRNCKSSLKEGVYKTLKKSVRLLSEQSKKWFIDELKKLENESDVYIDFVIQKLKSEKVSKTNTSKLFVMLYLIYKFELME